jgi:hypothetical protein
MKPFILLLFFSSVIQLYSQSWLPIHHDTVFEPKQELIFSGVADYASTSLHKSLTQKLFYGGQITDEIKAKSQKLQGGLNQFGSDLNAEIEYRNYKVNFLKNQNWGFLVKAGYYSFISALYSKDLFNLTFYGNQDYLGQTASISGTKFSSYSFQKIGFGWLDKKTKSNITLNVYNLSNHSQAFINTGEIFQSTAIDSLAVTYDGKVNFSDGASFFKGLGFGIDGELRFSVPTKKNKPIYYQLLCKNLGFASLIEPASQYAADTSFSFNGLSFNQVFNGARFLDSNFSIIDTLGIEKTSVKKTFLLPGFLQISKLVDSNSDRKLQEFYGVRMFLSSMYTPLVFAGLDYRVSIKSKAKLNIGINASYGGFTRYRFGLYTSLKMKNWNLGIASENILGITGQSLLIRLQCAF